MGRCVTSVEFAYNRIVHKTTRKTPIEIVYEFKPITPLEIMPLPDKEITSQDGAKKGEIMKKLHVKVKAQVEHVNSKVDEQHNKGRRKLIFSSLNMPLYCGSC